MKLTPRSGSLPRSQVIALVLCVANALMAMLPFGTDIQGSALAAVPIASQPRVGGHATRTGEDHFEVGPSPFDIQTYHSYCPQRPARGRVYLSTTLKL